jgi:hypothetical protein
MRADGNGELFAATLLAPCEQPDSVPLTVHSNSPPISAPGPDPEEFDWDTDDAVVVKPQPGIAVYQNKYGDTVVRTQNIADPCEGDHFAYVTPDAHWAVIEALTECAPKRK